MRERAAEAQGMGGAAWVPGMQWVWVLGARSGVKQWVLGGRLAQLKQHYPELILHRLKGACQAP